MGDHINTTDTIKEFSKSLLQGIIDNTGSIIYLKSVDNRYILVNRMYEKLFNLSREQLIGRTDHDIFPEDIANQLVENDKAVIAGKVSVILEEKIIVDGEEKIYISNKFPFYNEEGALIGICGISTEITERVLKMDIVGSSEEDFSTLVTNLPGIVYRCSPKNDWQMYYMSDFVLDLTGYPPEDFLKNKVRSFSSIIHPEDIEHTEDGVYAGLKEKGTYGLAYRILHKDGSIKWIYDQGSGFYDGISDDPLWLDGVIVDITEQVELSKTLELRNQELNKEVETRIKYENNLKELNENLEVMVEERTAELKEANTLLTETLEKLEKSQEFLLENRKMVAMRSLLQGLSHELNTPLGLSLTLSTYVENKLKNALQYINDPTANTLLSEAMEVLENETATINKAIEIIERLKLITDYSDNYDQKAYKIKDFISIILWEYNATLKESNIDFYLECEDELLIKSFPALMHQVISILISNSLIHGFKGKDSGKILLKIFETEDNMIVDYTDNGIGIDAHIIPKIFDPFFTTQMGKFSGLDLFLLYNLVTQKMQGKVTCESDINKGSRFLITLPL